MSPPRQPILRGVPALLAVIILAAGWILFGQAGRRVGAYPWPHHHPDGPRVDWLVDATKSDLAGILARPESAWQPREGCLHGKIGEVIWQRVTLPQAEAPQSGVIADINLYSDLVECYVPATDGGGGWTVMRSGQLVPAMEKPLAGREAAFPVQLAAGESKTIYVKSVDRFPGISELVWWPSAGQFMAARLHDVMAEGGYFGLLLALLFYNVALWARLRFPDTGRYVIYLIFAGLFMFVSRNEVLVLGGVLGSPWLEVGAMLLVSLSVIFLVDFARVFLDLPTSAPRWNRASLVLKTIMMGLAGWSLVLPWMKDSSVVFVAIFTGMFTQMVLLGGAIAAWRNGVRQSRYFVAAFGSFVVSLIPSLRIWCWSDGTEDNAAAGYAVLAGSAVEILLFSMATADRFAQIERENLATKEALLIEAEQRKAMQEAYADELESEVRERTGELMEANQDKDRMISVIGHDLRSPLTGLTQAAEQMRRAAPGVALDQFLANTVQTGRQLLLLIEDIVLWARLRAGSIELGSYPVSTLVQPVAELHRTVAQQRSIDLEVQLPADVRVRTDLVLAQTLLRNLLGNALKYSRRRVVLQAAVEGEGVRFSVQDDGPGLPPEVAAQFVNGAKMPPSAHGGMGLRLCREVGAGLGVKIVVSTSPEDGTRFMLTLPLAPTEDQA